MFKFSVICAFDAPVLCQSEATPLQISVTDGKRSRRSALATRAHSLCRTTAVSVILEVENKKIADSYVNAKRKGSRVCARACVGDAPRDHSCVQRQRNTNARARREEKRWRQRRQGTKGAESRTTRLKGRRKYRTTCSVLREKNNYNTSVCSRKEDVADFFVWSVYIMYRQYSKRNN